MEIKSEIRPENTQAWTGFEPITSAPMIPRYRSALPTELKSQLGAGNYVGSCKE